MNDLWPSRPTGWGLLGCPLPRDSLAARQASRFYRDPFGAGGLDFAAWKEASKGQLKRSLRGHREESNRKTT